ncbi:MAG: hypothetical protein HY298_03230 [Verrucomicrobia bacterium]|nr:hypothetical protein [Verrucomicrobiota bacterium]
MNANRLFTRVASVIVFSLSLFANSSEVLAADLKVEARLVWGTNEDKSPNPDHKPVDATLAKKLRKVFKWHNYFEVNRKTATIPQNQTANINMSSKCVLEVKNLGNARVEVKLIGKGKLVSKNAQTLTPGEDLIVAGDDKNDTAWFVVIRSVDSQ